MKEKGRGIKTPPCNYKNGSILNGIHSEESHSVASFHSEGGEEGGIVKE